MKDFIKRNALYGAWGVSLAAMLGSLYFSQIMHLPPCVLCWYQRICMYPLVLMLGFAIYKKDRNLVLPALVLAGIGWLISVYHNLLYYKNFTGSCSAMHGRCIMYNEIFEWFGFITIPFLSFAGFTIILIGLIIYWRKHD